MAMMIGTDDPGEDLRPPGVPVAHQVELDTGERSGRTGYDRLVFRGDVDGQASMRSGSLMAESSQGRTSIAGTTASRSSKS
ncbi:hypothetical protein ABZS29_21140 [Kribbella sp. NPDC005582]|uniref:hypothetical protein n=1 Tax=Kribbella sp. NPDC005582 TaxID=3156893 RepID=UPI0033B9E0BE